MGASAGGNGASSDASSGSDFARDFEEVKLEDAEGSVESPVRVQTRPVGSSTSTPHMAPSEPEPAQLANEQASQSVSEPSQAREGPESEGSHEEQAPAGTGHEPALQASVRDAPKANSKPQQAADRAQAMGAVVGFPPSDIPADAQVSDAEVMDAFKEDLAFLEKSASKVAGSVSAKAKEVSSKLFSGETKASLTSLAGSVSNWWSTFDPTPPKPAEDEAARQIAATTSATEAVLAKGEIQTLFGLPETEQLMEEFPCVLVQSYECTHNTFTPAQEVRIPGTLYITSHHSCFTGTEGKTAGDSVKVSMKLPHDDIASAETSKLEDATSALQIDFGEGQYVRLVDFPAGGADGALALLEHLTADDEDEEPEEEEEEEEADDDLAKHT